jgi:hypothetical protein
MPLSALQETRSQGRSAQWNFCGQPDVLKGVKRNVQGTTMIDYNFIVLARLEYQERIRKIEEELLARQQMERLPSTSDRLLFAVGEWLEHAGAQLKAQHQPAIQPTYHGSHAR